MNKTLLWIITILIVICTVAIAIAYTEHKSKVIAQQQVETLTQSNQALEKYIKQKNNAYTELNNKFNNLLIDKPLDTCGDTIVSESIINWLKGGN